MNDILEYIRRLTEQDLRRKSIMDMVLSAAEEFGEFAREIKIEEGVFGNSHKEPGDDGSVGEAVDMVIMALALYYARFPTVTGKNPELATQELPSLLKRKAEKWERNQNRG